MVATWTWERVNRRRLQRHGLADGAAFASPDQAAAAICGAHAQVVTAGELSLGLRLDGATRDDVRDAVATHTLVKTYGPRGTVHLLPLAELPLMAGALGTTPAAVPSHFPDGIRLEPDQLEAVVTAVGTALADAELTVDELTGAVGEIAGAWAVEPVMPAFGGMWPRWRQATAAAAYRGVLCFGPNRGRKVTYTNPRRWLPDLRPVPGAMPWLVRRYLHAYGPAGPAAFARWLSCPPAFGTKVFRELGDELTEVSVDGRAAYVVAGDDAPDEDVAELPGVRLLPYFDAFGVGCHPRELLFPGRAADRALARTQAGNFPVLLVEGTVAGVWHQRTAGKWLEVTVEALSPLSAKRRREVGEQVERIAAFGGKAARLTFGPVSAGAHA